MSWYKMTRVAKTITAEVYCPKCGAPMKLRKGPYNEFYGCTNYPGCRGSVSLVDAPKNQVPKAPMPRPNQPQVQQQQPQKPNNEVVQPLARKTWFLATMLDGGIPVVVSKKGNYWEYMKEDGTGAEIPAAEIAKVVKSVADIGGQKISGEVPSILFKKFRELNNQVGGDEGAKAEEAVAEDPNKVQGRIPAERISPQQKEIEESFLNTPQSIMINALAGSGKAQPLDAKLLTPNGWIRMGDVKIGDQIFGSDGLPHEVMGVFPQGKKEVFEVEMSDGSKTECCEEHLWLTETKQDRDLDRYHKEVLFSRAKVRKLSEIKNDLLYKGYPKHYVPITNALEFDYQDTGIDPYIMGVLLGDGSFRTGCVSFSSKDPEIIKYIEDSLPERLSCNPTGHGCDYRISGRIKGVRNPIVSEIKKLNLWTTSSDKKFIPDVYKFNTIETRISILQGLLDTDGYISERNAEYCTTSYRLAKDVSFLVQSLGGTAKISSRITSYTYLGIKKKGKLSYRIYIKLPKHIKPFRLKRKLSKYLPSTKYHAKRSIVNIKSVGKKECQCISVNSNDNLYITDDCILTHNTTMLRHLASFKDPNQKWLYLVFNKKNQVEASTGKGKFPNGVEVKTSHSFLGQVLGRSAELGAVQFTDLWNQGGERIAIMADAMMDGDNTFPNSVKYAAKQTIKQVASLAKAFAVHPKSQTAATDIDSIITKYSIDTDLTTNNSKPANNAQTFKPQIIDKVLDLLYYCLPGNCNVPQCEGMRDHDDTLWYSAISPDVKFPKYDVVLADEVQDFNTCQTIMLQKLSEAGARIVAVGDPNQAIYMFRGADAQAFNKVQGVLGNAPNGNVPHELPVNYRSGRNIIQYVNQKTKVKNLVAGRDFDGQVTEGVKAEDALGNIANEKARTGKLATQTAFLARTNAPLVNTALSLMKSNVDFVIIGRDFSKELIDHLKKVVGVGRNSRRVPIQQLGQVLSSFYTETEAKWRNKISKEAELKDMKAVTEALGNIVGHLEANGFTDRGLNMRVTDSETFINFIKSKFAGVNIDDAGEAEKLRNKDPLSYVTLTSAHRSKGLEFDRVYILEPNLFPHPKSKTPDALDQEENAKYVAFTRAMKQLHVLAPSEDKKKKGREVDASAKKKKGKRGWYVKAKGKKAK